jgi:hypothetical protein
MNALIGRGATTIAAANFWYPVVRVWILSGMGTVHTWSMKKGNQLVTGRIAHLCRKERKEHNTTLPLKLFIMFYLLRNIIDLPLMPWYLHKRLQTEHTNQVAT